MDDRYDVIVVGARCAGASVARLLALQGQRVLAVDRASFPSDTLSTHSISGHGIRLLARWGLLDRVLATGVPNPHTVGIRLGDVDLPAIPHPSGDVGSLAPRRTVLDHLLVEAARHAGVDVREGVTVRGVLRDGERVAGIATDLGEIGADLVIGADGVGSVVARSVGAARYDERASNASGMYAYYRGDPAPHNELALADGRFALAFPTNDRLTCLGVAGPTRELAALIRGGDAAFSDAVAATAPRIADLLHRSTRTTRFFLFRAQPGFFNVAAGPGWALVGDAGHYKDPALGQGIADAFLSAQLLADVIDAGDPLEEYHRRRDEVFTDMYVVTHEVASMTWRNDELLELFGRYRAGLDGLTATVEHSFAT